MGALAYGPWFSFQYPRGRTEPAGVSSDVGLPGTVEQSVKIDNELYVRDNAKCILHYNYVEACGKDVQNTFAIAVAGRGVGAHISTEYEVPLPDSACVYCGNCIGATGGLMIRSDYEFRLAGTWDET